VKGKYCQGDALVNIRSVIVVDAAKHEDWDQIF
jgi:hypothetical protein